MAPSQNAEKTVKRKTVMKTGVFRKRKRHNMYRSARRMLRDQEFQLDMLCAKSMSYEEVKAEQDARNIFGPPELSPIWLDSSQEPVKDEGKDVDEVKDDVKDEDDDTEVHDPWDPAGLFHRGPIIVQDPPPLEQCLPQYIECAMLCMYICLDVRRDIFPAFPRRLVGGESWFSGLTLETLFVQTAAILHERARFLRESPRNFNVPRWPVHPEVIQEMFANLQREIASERGEDGRAEIDPK